MADDPESGSTALQHVPATTPPGGACSRLAVVVLDQATPITSAIDMVADHFCSLPRVDVVATALMTFAPEDSSGWTRLGERAWVRERVRPGTSCSITPGQDLGPEAALSLPWLSAHGRSGVLALTDTDLLPPEADLDREELTRCGIRALIGSGQSADGVIYGSVSLGSTDPGMWPEEYVADLRLLSAALTARMAAAQARRSLGDAIAVAERARMNQQDLLGALGHELRTPLAAIIGYADLLLDDVATQAPTELATRVARNGDVILRAGEQVLAVVEDLLETGRTLRTEHERVSVDVATAARDVLHWHRATARAAGVELTCGVEPGITVWARPSGLRQALTNLVGNAILHNRPGGTVTVEVERLSGEANQPRMRIIVRDTGPGMTTAELSRIFRPFVRLADDTAMGTGLGLPLARAVVERDGGIIDATSQEGSGSTFWIDLPAD